MFFSLSYKSNILTSTFFKILKSKVFVGYHDIILVKMGTKVNTVPLNLDNDLKLKLMITELSRHMAGILFINEYRCSQ